MHLAEIGCISLSMFVMERWWTAHFDLLYGTAAALIGPSWWAVIVFWVISVSPSCCTCYFNTKLMCGSPINRPAGNEVDCLTAVAQLLCGATFIIKMNALLWHLGHKHLGYFQVFERALTFRILLLSAVFCIFCSPVLTLSLSNLTLPDFRAALSTQSKSCLVLVQRGTHHFLLKCWVIVWSQLK